MTIRVRRTLEGERVGCMFLDAGTTSGLGWGEFDLTRKKSSYEVAKVGMRSTVEVNYDGEFWWSAELDSAEHIAQQWLELQAEWTLQGIPVENRIFVFEDFILRPGKQHSSARSGLSSARIMSMVMGMLYQYEPRYWPLQPSDVKAIDNKRLKTNNLWVVGSEHRRDVCRQAVVFARKAVA